MLAAAAVCGAAAAVSGIALDYSDPDAATAYVLTHGLRLGAGPGREYRFLVDLDPAAKSTLTESNSLYSKYYGVDDPGGNNVFDVVSTPSVALNATFVLAPTADISTLSFYGLAAAFPEGAHICRRSMAPGRAPPHCNTGRVAEGECDDDVGCFFRGRTKNGNEVRVLVDASVPLKKCSENITLLPTKAEICTVPAVVTTPAGPELVHKAPLGDFGDFAFWTNGEDARLHFFAEPEDPVERAGVALLGTIAFLAWCESTRSLTTAVVANTALPPIFSRPGKHAAELSLALLTPILFADATGMLAFSTTSAVYHRGVTVLDPAVPRLLSKGFAEALAVLLNAYAWYATSLAWIVLVGRVYIGRLAFMNDSDRRLQGLALLTRMTVETATMATVHAQLPRNKLGTFALIIGLAFGVVAAIIVARDTVLIMLVGHDAVIRIVAGFTAGAFLVYATLAMILPAIADSTAVLNYNNASLAFSCTLALQVVGIGATAARRKIAEQHAARRPMPKLPKK